MAGFGRRRKRLGLKKKGHAVLLLYLENGVRACSVLL